MFSSWKIYLIVGAAVAVIAGLGYWYFSWSQARIAQLVADKAKLELSVEEQKKTILNMQEFQTRQAANIARLQSDLAAAEDEKAKLTVELAKHDLTALARAKPQLIERRINDASRKILRELSGASK